MRARPATAAFVHGLVALVRMARSGLFLLGIAAFMADASASTVLRFTEAEVIDAGAPGDARSGPAARIGLPDDWAASRPARDGEVRYRIVFDRPASARADALYALYIERACSAVDLQLNGQLLHRFGRDADTAAAACRHPELVTLPAALLRERGNTIDLRVRGRALQHVGSRDFSAGLSQLLIGPRDELTAQHDRHLFWREGWIRLSAVLLFGLGCLMLVLAWHNRHEVYFGYFGALCIGWAVLSARLWIAALPWPPALTENLFCIGVATLVGLAVQFLLSYAGLRSRAIEAALLVQWLLVPLSLIVGGEAYLFTIANAWYALYALELLAIAALFLGVTWRDRRHDFWPMAAVLGTFIGVLLAELGWQQGLYEARDWGPEWPLLPIVMPVLLAIVAARLFGMFARALRTAEAGRTALARRVRELTTEFEGNFSQLAELRVEQVTEKERKRIAADLHDDLGAKLLTIVHTSDNERITALAREALEDMRLSVKGLIGKPLRLADALADWRAETVARLGQAKIDVDWQSSIEETDHLLPSRGFVQTTRILREAVSNIVKHSQATHCSVRCRIADGQFAMTIRDDGRGIPMELDGNLDRGLGMSSMKRRAKQMRGQCLVQSGPGYGTVIALTVPL
jgi:signal transduction histidine kinase